MTYTILVADDINQAGLSVLEHAPEFEVVKAAGSTELLESTLPRAHAILVRSTTKVTSKILADAPNLRVVGRAGIGVDNVDVTAATQRGIAVINAPGANTVSAAEHTIALLLALLRRIPEAVASMADGEWDRKKFSGTELRGKTLGIAGYGRVGSHVANLARAFGMSVLVFDPFLAESGITEKLVSFETLLREADVVSLHMPLTSETRGIMNRERLLSMKPSAVLVNTARGGLVDERALAEAVAEGAILGAALDVFSEEPLAGDSPLRRCERIIITPHLGASTAEAQERVSIEICASTMEALLNGNVKDAVNIPGVSGEVFGKLRLLLDLAVRVGKLAAGVVGGTISTVEVTYHGSDDEAPKPIMLAAMEGVLKAVGASPVSVINSMSLAHDRGIRVERRVGHSHEDFETTLGVTVTTTVRSTTVVGAMVGEQGRIVRIDDFKVDFVPEGHVIILRNHDVPGVIGRVGSLLGESNINIASYHQSRHDGGGEAIAAIAVDHEANEDLVKRLCALSDVIDVRQVSLGT